MFSRHDPCSLWRMFNSDFGWDFTLDYCPRRLLYMGHKADEAIIKGETQTKLLEKCDYPKGTLVGIWAEAKVKYTNEG